MKVVSAFSTSWAMPLMCLIFVHEGWQNSSALSEAEGISLITNELFYRPASTARADCSWDQECNSMLCTLVRVLLTCMCASSSGSQHGTPRLPCVETQGHTVPVVAQSH